MPSYDYECAECGFKFRVSHSITTKMVDCTECETESSLNRYSGRSHFKIANVASDKKTGDIVKESIKEFKSDLEEQKQQIIGEEYNG